MGEFTALDDGQVDETVAMHLQHIVATVRSRMEPQAIILRGSFGRGEGSVMVGEGHLRFLSDYEIDVATRSPFYRSLFAQLSAQLTKELGVDTSLRWVRPDYLYVGRIGPFPTGPAPLSISLYESRFGSRMLYGQDIVNSSPTVDPTDITPRSGVRLILNRMAESLYYMGESADPVQDEPQSLWWANKCILACAESLLLLWGEYHYSYRERGERFARMAPDRLGFMRSQNSALIDLVARSTEFKLRPSRALYPETAEETWRQVVPICDTVFRQLCNRILCLSFRHYNEFPEQFLRVDFMAFRPSSPYRSYYLAKALDAYKYLRRRRWPRGLRLSVPISQVVYAVVPLVFAGWASDEESLCPALAEARRCLALICRLRPPAPHLHEEWNALRQHTLWAWKNFCYL